MGRRSFRVGHAEPACGRDLPAHRARGPHRGMRTLILTDTSLWGGLETHAAALAQTLADAGHQVTILCLDARACDLFRRAVPPAVEVAALDRPPKPTLRGWLRALRGIEADGVLLEKGTLNTGGFALD